MRREPIRLHLADRVYPIGAGGSLRIRGGLEMEMRVPRDTTGANSRERAVRETAALTGRPLNPGM